MSQNMLSRYTQLKAQKEQIEEEMKRIEGDERFRREKEFLDRLQALMDEFGKDAKGVIEILYPSKPSAQAAASEQSSQRRKRKLKIYKNPNTGERIETRGGNHKKLKAWKVEFGDETVESWLVDTQE
ncbi:histone-like nucleoid-structuring protein, MvaT/MvaU family [Modicisalibacter luteus]|uniref:Histone-like nucleoid-structuring protein, MvaT/MvaU family n=1 Tax=Modicisalibacter luteus TaxID=453962 RepID=A0ABV7M4V0_9GAMM|nr:histone-like nucleoid-structuring protein, MvaT/MvaU family [Halomonas lutea]GHB15659.1 hypothetical protein GCM10007159_42480 [Halomonas lutea]